MWLRCGRGAQGHGIKSDRHTHTHTHALALACWRAGVLLLCCCRRPRQETPACMRTFVVIAVDKTGHCIGMQQKSVRVCVNEGQLIESEVQAQACHASDWHACVAATCVYALQAVQIDCWQHTRCSQLRSTDARTCSRMQSGQCHSAASTAHPWSALHSTHVQLTRENSSTCFVGISAQTIGQHGPATVAQRRSCS